MLESDLSGRFALLLAQILRKEWIGELATLVEHFEMAAAATDEIFRNEIFRQLLMVCHIRLSPWELSRNSWKPSQTRSPIAFTGLGGC